MTFKALLLDEADVLVDVVELESNEQLTDRHVDFRPYGGECDCQPGAYRWDRERKALLPLPRQRKIPEDGVPSLEQAFHALCTGGNNSPMVQAWVQWFEKRMDSRRVARGRK